MTATSIRNIPDYVGSYKEAEKLVKNIKRWWAQHGDPYVAVYIEQSPPLNGDKRKIYSVRSNLRFSFMDVTQN